MVKSYNYQTLGLFMQDGWQLHEKFLIEAGLRSDYHDQFGLFVLPRIAFFYKLKPNFSFRLSGGTGYKAPNVFTQQTLSANFKKLLPLDNTTTAERSQGVNFDINYHTILFDKVSVQLNQAFYFTHIDNPVTTAYDSLGKVSLVNGNYTVNSTGADTYLRFTYNTLELYLGYNHTIAQQLSSSANQYVYFSPHDKFSTTIAYEIEEVWRFGLEGSWIGNQYIAPNKTARDFWFFAAMIQRKIGKVSIVVNCENIFDFRQSSYESIFTPPVATPVFKDLWGPIDGRVVNLSIRIKI